MPKRRVVQVGRLNHGERLQIESFGRKGSGQRTPRLSPEQVARVSRTVRRVPEVVVKVSGGGRDGGAVRAHVSYIDRHGKLPIETERGARLPDRRVAKALVHGWALDSHPDRHTRPPPRGTRPKVVHNLVLSMPAKVDPEKVLAAARKFARENFALAHRYAMVLHTDTKHPHVHLVVKAEREDGAGRLNIYKATLREWREQFAQYLREQGVEANATPAALRGRPRAQLRDPIFRAARRGVSNLAATDEADRQAQPLPGSSFLAKRA